MMDEDVDKAIWDTFLPIEFVVADNEQKCYMLMKRVAYFPFAYDQIAQACDIKLYEDDTVSVIQSIPLWLEFNDVALKWHLPVGVLYDCLAFDDAADVQPWSINVHQKDYPRKKILDYNNPGDIEHHFLSRIKEASFIKRGELDRQGSVDAQSLKKLWDALKHDRYNDFNTVNKDLMKPQGDSNHFSSFPFCVYKCKKQLSEDKEGKAHWEIVDLLRKKYDINSSSGIPLTLNDLIYELFKDKYSFVNETQGPTSTQEATTTTTPTSTTTTTIDTPSHTTGTRKAEILMHGVHVPLNAPLQWLAVHMCHPDNFCHIVLRVYE
eukprot:m.3482 g.3482  ORF g.3482 m.3482 type:complete len:322 (-) comp2075_c1_seq1:37-1002(-)